MISGGKREVPNAPTTPKIIAVEWSILLGSEDCLDDIPDPAVSAAATVLEVDVELVRSRIEDEEEMKVGWDVTARGIEKGGVVVMMEEEDLEMDDNDVDVVTAAVVRVDCDVCFGQSNLSNLEQNQSLTYRSCSNGN